MGKTIGLIIAISIGGSILLVLLISCLLAFFTPIFEEILSELKDRGEDIADKIHDKLQPQPEQLEPVSLSDMVAAINRVIKNFATTLEGNFESEEDDKNDNSNT